MTWGIMPGYRVQIWKDSVFCVARWKVLKNKISSSVQVRWVAPGRLCTATVLTSYPQAQHGTSSRERWVCPRAYRSCVWISQPAAPSCSRTQGLHTPGTLKNMGCHDWDLGPGSVSLENNSDFQLPLLSTLPVFNQCNYCWALAHRVVKCFRG